MKFKISFEAFILSSLITALLGLSGATIHFLITAMGWHDFIEVFGMFIVTMMTIFGGGYLIGLIYTNIKLHRSKRAESLRRMTID